jgi:hypothetical protein
VTRRAWLCVAAAYALLAIGALVTITVFSVQQNDLEQQADESALTAGAFCQILYDNDQLERISLAIISAGGPIRLNDTCKGVVERLTND